jgi:hypothetical protein
MNAAQTITSQLCMSIHPLDFELHIAKWVNNGNVLIFHNPNIKECCLFVCLFCFMLRSPKPQCPLIAFLVLLGKSLPTWWVGVHGGGIILFIPMVHESWNIEQVCHWKLNKIKTNLLWTLRCALDRKLVMSRV